MNEFVAAILCGAVGGLFRSVALHDIAWGGPYTNANGLKRLDPGTPGSVFVGMFIAACIVGLNHTTHELDGPATNYAVLFSAALTGFGGGHVVESFFDQAVRRNALGNTSDIVDTLVNEVERVTDKGDTTQDRHKRVRLRKIQRKGNPDSGDIGPVGS